MGGEQTFFFWNSVKFWDSIKEKKDVVGGSVSGLHVEDLLKKDSV